VGKSFLRRTFYAVVLVAFGTCVASAEDRELIQKSPYTSQQEVRVQTGDPFFLLEIDPAKAALMDPALRDLRLYSGEYELGYAIVPNQPDHRRKEISLEILNEGSYEGQRYGFVVVMPDNEFASSSISIKLNHEPYLVKGTLYGSSDNGNWQQLRPITFFGIDEKYSELSLEGIAYRYLKFEFQQPPGEILVVEEAVVYSSLERVPQESSTWVSRPVSQSNYEKESLLLIDLEYQNRVSTQWVLDILEQGFYRQAVFEGSNDKSYWEPIGTTYLYRGVANGDEQLSFHYPPGAYRYLRVRILNEDNEPLSVQTAQVRTHPMRLVVKSPPAPEGSTIPVTAYWGNSELQSPSYDVKQWLGTLKLDQLSVGAMGEPIENPNYQPAKAPWTERFPLIMPLALILASVGVGFILYRNVKQMRH
jgi:hypothetical protein